MITAVRIDALLPVVLAEHGIPGAAVGLVAGGEEHVFCAGVTNVAHPLEVTPTTMFQIASISKILTATAAVRLAERGVLRLDEPVRTYLPDLRLADEDCAARLTLEDLLCHRAGWPGDFDVDTGRGDDALARLRDTWAAAPQWTPLRTQYSYSNLGYGLAGHVLATVACRTFEDVVTREVIEPLGLGRTAYFLEDVAFERWAAGHRRSGELAPWWRPRARGPNGGVLSCMEDLLAFARSHLGSDDGMKAPRIVDTIDTSVGLGWMVHRWGSVDAVAHYGSTYGYAGALVLLPSAGIALAVLTNAAHGGAVFDTLGRALLREVFDEPLGEPATAGSLPPGVYEGQNATIVVRGDEATLDAEGRRVALRPAGPDAFTYDGAPLASRFGAVIRDPDGRATFLRVGRRLYRRTGG